MKALRRAIVIGLGCAAALSVLLWLLITRPVSLFPGTYQPEQQVDPRRLQAHVRRLSEDFVPRDSSHPENLFRTAAYIQTALSASAAKVVVQPFETQGKRFVNVIGAYGPETEELLVVGAHYDAFSVFPGADDNASGVAGLIELGGLLQHLALRTRVELVAYPLEEPPHFSMSDMGSAAHARSLREKNRKVKLMIALEMLGCFSEADGSQQYPAKLLRLFYPHRGNFIAVVDQTCSLQAQQVKATLNRCTELPAYSINAPAFVPGIDFSDHRSYWAEGFPAVMLTDTAFYRNPFYHTAHDTWEKLDYEKMAKIVYGVFKHLQQLDAAQ